MKEHMMYTRKYDSLTEAEHYLASAGKRKDFVFGFVKVKKSEFKVNLIFNRKKSGHRRQSRVFLP